MEFCELGSLSYECFFPDLFPEAIVAQKPNIWRYEEECQEKREEEVGKEEWEISHTMRIGEDINALRRASIDFYGKKQDEVLPGSIPV